MSDGFNVECFILTGCICFYFSLYYDCIAYYHNVVLYHYPVNKILKAVQNTFYWWWALHEISYIDLQAVVVNIKYNRFSSTELLIVMVMWKDTISFTDSNFDKIKNGNCDNHTLRNHLTYCGGNPMGHETLMLFSVFKLFKRNLQVWNKCLWEIAQID